MPDHFNLHRRKALLALAGAESEFAAGRYNNAIGRAYYYCFHLAVAARIAAGERPDRTPERWRHGLTLRALDRLLTHWSEAANLLGQMADIYSMRLRAGYELPLSTEMEASETIERAKVLGAVIERHVPFRPG